MSANDANVLFPRRLERATKAEHVSNPAQTGPQPSWLTLEDESEGDLSMVATIAAEVDNSASGEIGQDTWTASLAAIQRWKTKVIPNETNGDLRCNV